MVAGGRIELTILDLMRVTCDLTPTREIVGGCVQHPPMKAPGSSITFTCLVISRLNSSGGALSTHIPIRWPGLQRTASWRFAVSRNREDTLMRHLIVVNKKLHNFQAGLRSRNRLLFECSGYAHDTMVVNIE